MEYIVLILMFITTFGGWLFTLDDSNYKKLIGGFSCVIIPVIILTWIIAYNRANNSTALDVYRGKTMLEITYRDSIPTDSVVVFK